MAFVLTLIDEFAFDIGSRLCLEKPTVSCLYQ